MSVVSAVELEDHVASGGSSGESHCGHGGFSAGVDEADHLDGWDGVDDEFCGVNFDLGWSTEGCAAGGGFLCGLGDVGVCVAEDERAPGADVVDVGVAVGIGDFGAAAGGEEEGGSADGSPSSGGAVYAAGDEVGGGFVEGLGDGRGTGSCHGNH